MLGRRRLLAVTALVLGAAVATAVAACAESDSFDFKPTGIGRGRDALYDRPPEPHRPTPTG
jgi:hypothetical protein